MTDLEKLLLGGKSKDYNPQFYELYIVGNQLKEGEKASLETLKKTTREGGVMAVAPYFQCRMHTVEELHDGKRVISGALETNNFFKNSDKLICQIIEEELAEGNFKPLATEPNVVKLTKGLIKGVWAEKTTPWLYKMIKVLPNGTTEWLKSNRKTILSDGTIKWTPDVVATKSNIRLFIPYNGEDSMRYEAVQNKLEAEIRRLSQQKVVPEGESNPEDIHDPDVTTPPKTTAPVDKVTNVTTEVE